MTDQLAIELTGRTDASCPSLIHHVGRLGVIVMDYVEPGP